MIQGLQLIHLVKEMEQQKEKPKKFLLPSALRHLQESKKIETQNFIKQLHEPQSIIPKKDKKHQSLFKLNPSSTALISEIPVDTLRQRSKSQKLESLHQDTVKQAFSLMDHYKESRVDNRIHEKQPTLKKYNIDLRQMAPTQSKFEAGFNEEVQPEKYEIVHPSEAYGASQIVPEALFKPTIFQTPILPCFASQFQNKLNNEGSKRIIEGEGVWKIGKMKVKKGSCELRVGEFLFVGSQVRGEGKAAVLSESNLFSVPNWQQMWILQPHDSLFN